jgi:hypothetical protein
MDKVGFTLTASQEMGTIYQCNGQQFRVEGGKVVKYGE